MLHFGLPPRFAKDVAFIQVDINAEELTRGLALQGKFYNTLKICTKFFRFHEIFREIDFFTGIIFTKFFEILISWKIGQYFSIFRVLWNLHIILCFHVLLIFIAHLHVMHLLCIIVWCEKIHNFYQQLLYIITRYFQVHSKGKVREDSRKFKKNHLFSNQTLNILHIY